MASLLEMEEWGGTDAESIKNAIDNIFSDNGNIPLHDYQTKLVSITADGASVNTGDRNGLFKKLEVDGNRPWLLKIHCANHRVELAVARAFEESRFAEVYRFYIQNFYLLKNSGLIKSEVKGAASALGIQNYSLTKLTGTHFVQPPTASIPKSAEHVAGIY